MDNDVEIKFGAQIEELKAKLRDVYTSFKSVADTASSELAGRAGAAFGVFGSKAEQAATTIISKYKELPPVMRGVAAAALGVGAAIAAGLAAKRFADDNAEMVESTRDLARALGITTNEASVMRAAFDDLGVSQGEFEGLAKGLARQLRTNEEELKRQGLATRDAAGNLRPLNDMVLDGIKLLREYKEGADRNITSQALFGRGLDASSRLLLLNKEVIEQNRQAVQELGLEVGEAAVKGWEDYDAAADRASLTLKAIGKAIAESVLPVVTELTEWFNNVAPAAIVVIRGAIGGLTTAFLGLTNGVRVAWEVINAMVITVAEPIRAVAEAIGRAMVGDFKGAGEAIKNVPTVIAGAWETAFAKIEASSQKTSERIGRVWAWATGDSSKTGDSGSAAGTKTANDKPVKSSGAMGAANLALQKAEQEAELSLQQEYIRQAQAILEDAYRENLLGAREYFAARLGVEERGLDLLIAAKRREAEAAKQAQAEAAAQAKTADPKDREKFEAQAIRYQTEQVKLIGDIAVLEAKRGDIVRANAAAYRDVTRAQQDALAQLAATGEKSTADSKIATERADLEALKQLRRISADEAFTIQRQLEQRSFAAAQAALMVKQELARGDVLKQGELAAEAESLERDHQARMVDIDRAAALESARYSIQAQESVQQSFATMIDGLLAGVQKVEDVFRNFAVNLANSFTNLIAQKFTQRLFDASGLNGMIDSAVGLITQGIESIVSALFTSEAKKLAIKQAAAAKDKALAVAEAAANKALVAGDVAVTEVAEVAKTGATVAGAASRTGAEITSATTSKAVTGESALFTIGAKAWEAASSVYAAIAAIPYVGPFLAPVMAAAAAVAVLGFASRIFSSEGGEMQVGADRLNLVHKDETILPANFAAGLRKVVGEGGTNPLMQAVGMVQSALASGTGAANDAGYAAPAAAVGGWSMPTSLFASVEQTTRSASPSAGSIDAARTAVAGAGGNHFNIQAWDGADVRRVLQKHGKELVGSLRMQSRNFAPVKG